MSNDIVLDITEWDKAIWLATDGGGVNIIYPDTHDIQILSNKENRQFPANSVTCLCHSNNHMWIGMVREGVLGAEKGFITTYTKAAQNPASGLSDKCPLCLWEDKDGRIWIGTDGGGINILEPETGQLSLLEHIPGRDNYSLPANSILSLYNDRNNNIWAGSIRNGLISIREVSMVTYTDVVPGNDRGLSNNTILSLYQQSDDKIWIGTDGGGINLFDPATGKFHHILSTWEEKVASITGMDKDHLLVSLFSQGLFIFHKETHRYQPLVIINDSINDIFMPSGKKQSMYIKILLKPF